MCEVTVLVGGGVGENYFVGGSPDCVASEHLQTLARIHYQVPVLHTEHVYEVAWKTNHHFTCTNKKLGIKRIIDISDDQYKGSI